MGGFIFRRFIFCSLITICAIVSPFGSARAAPPQFEVTDVDDLFVDEFLTEGCGFEVNHTIVGKVKLSVDQDGFFKARIALKHTITGPGGSLTWPDVGIDKLVAFTDDGVTRVETVQATGVFIRIIVPGYGVVFGNTGHETRVFTIDVATGELLNFELLFDAGLDKPFDESDLEIICGALAA